MQRDSALDRLRAGAEVFDIVIVGGGASGLGAAVDAAARGYRVALIEQSDFAKGTSSRSTKLVHGGVRYLKQGNLSLVRDGLRERSLLLRNAPHLVRNLAFVIPNYARWEGHYYGLGMKAYDWLAGDLSLGASRRLDRRATVEHLPTVETQGLTGGVLYHDGQFDDARLAINLAATAASLGAVLANYCACAGLVKERGAVCGVLAREMETGAEFTVRAKVVINATGVFVDTVRRFDDAGAAPLVTVSQGAHVVLAKRFLPGNAALMVPKTADGRVLFAIPWHDRVVVGTTDTPGLMPALEPRPLAQELEFILDHARQYLAEDPDEKDVLSTFAGLRPLVRSAEAKSTAALSRDHTIVVSASKLVTITGGKWTTYRKMAEEVIDHAEEIAGFPPRETRTKALPIHGANSPADTPAAEAHLKIYGSDAAEIAKLARANPALAALLHPALPNIRAEVVWHARHEMARTVEDVLARRTRALLLDARASIEAASAVAQLLASELGRDAIWMEQQASAYASLASGYLVGEAKRMAAHHP